MRQMGATVTQSNQNIAADHLCATLTNDATPRLVFILLTADQVAGGGDYIAYIKRKNGAGGTERFVGPKTTYTAAAGETNIEFDSGPLVMRGDDRLLVYIKGLAGDIATPDLAVELWEDETAIQVNGALGTDGQVLLSADAQTGVVIPTVGAVSGNVGGNLLGNVNGNINGILVNSPVCNCKRRCI